MSFSTKILVGLLAGIAVGLFLGEWVAPMKLLADGFVKLLQMTVLPYVTISIISSLGRLDFGEAKRLGARAGASLVALWIVALTFTFLLPLVFPKVENASFFSSALIEKRPPFNFVDLYIPANPFHSLANNIVPAVVLFSVILGLALIKVEQKRTLLEVLAIVGDTMSRATRFIVRLTPYGIFAIAANAAGTLSIEQVESIQIYLIAYAAVSLLVAFWALPGLVAALTPFRIGEIFRATRDALITAFIAGDLFIVLPALTEACTELIKRHVSADEQMSRLPDAIVPVSFNFPHTGKLLSISFILFAGWFADAAIPTGDYPKLALTGLLTFFGSLNVAVPFLLDLFRIPLDTFQLFLATGVINSRFGTLLAAVHTVSVGLLGSAAIAGVVRVNPARLIRYLIATTALSVLTFGGLRIAFATLLKPSFHGAELVYSMKPLFPHSPPKVSREVPPGGRPVDARQEVLAEIRARGLLRVGFLADRLPFAFFGRGGELVGFDVDMAHRLAQDLQVGVEFVQLDTSTFPEALTRGDCNIMMTGAPVTPERATRLLFSEPYLDETLAFVVLDYLREQFSSWASVRALGPVRIGVPNLAYYIAEIRDRLPEARLEVIPENQSFLGDNLGFEALVLPAERGSVLTLLAPKFTVVVPEPDIVKVPLAYPLARHDQRWASFINTWIELKRKDGTIDALYRHWILGQNARKQTPRWSIVRNVLHWVE